MVLSFLRPTLTRAAAFVPLITLLFALGTEFCRAQPDTLEHTLLWRIEGKGLAKPSYLYGTFHTPNAQMFNFRDSVLPALLSCDIAAFELDVNAMSVEILRRTYNPDSVVDLREYLTDEEFDILDERIREQTGLPGETFRYADPSFLLLLVDQPEEVNYDELSYHLDDEDSTEEKFSFQLPKETFLDAWLFRTAQLEGKRAIGLETIDEQIAISDTIPLPERIHMLVETITVDGYERLETSKRMIAAYLREDLNELIQIVDDEEVNPGILFKLLTERNRNMANRMEGLMREGGTFTAIGAAHLPGDEGVIALLRRKGYDVTPVISERTGTALRYKRPQRDLPWYPLVDTEQGFSLETPLPTIDFPTDLLDSDIGPYQPAGFHFPKMRRRFITDISTGLTFIIIEKQITLYSLLNESDPFSAAIETWFGTNEEDESTSLLSLLNSRSSSLMRTKQVEVDGVQGKEYTGVDNDGDLTRIRVFQRGETMYTFLVSGGTSVIKSKDDSRFLKSIHFKPLPPATWKTYDIPPLSIRVSFPAELSIDTSRNWSSALGAFAQTISRTTVDPSTGIHYDLTYITPSSTLIPAVDSAIVDGQMKSLLTPDSILNESSTSIKTEGEWRSGVEYQATLASGITLTRRIFLNGARAISLTVARPSGTSDPEGEKRFFNWTKRTSGISTATTTQRYSDLNFSVALRDPTIDSLQSFYYTYGSGKSFNTSEWNGGQSFTATAVAFSPYYESQSEEKFFAGQREYITNTGDSIRDEHKVEAAGLHWREYTILPDSDRPGVKIRERIALHGAHLYRLRWFSLNPNDNPRDADQFFQSFKLLSPEPKGNIFTRKVDKLLKDISSSDSTLHSPAINALWGYTFRQEDLPKLYDALKRSYPNATDSTDVTRDRIIGAFGEVHDEKTVSTFKEIYRKLPPNHYSRPTLLNALATIRTEESLTAFRDILMKDPPTNGYSYTIFSAFYDSIKGIGTLYPDIIQLAESPTYRSTIFYLTNQALDSGEITLQGIGTRHQMIREIGAGLIRDYRENSYSEDDYYSEDRIYPWEVEQAIVLLGKLPPEKTTDNLLKRTLRDGELSVERASAVALLQHGEEVREKWLTNIAEDRTERLNLYRSLKNAGLLQHFPKEYRSQLLFAESLIDEALAWSEEEAPDEIEYVADRQVEWNGKLVRGYLFKYRYRWYGEDEDREWGDWQVIFCAQPDDPNEVAAESGQVRFNWTTFNPETIDTHFNDLMSLPEQTYDYGD